MQVGYIQLEDEKMKLVAKISNINSIFYLKKNEFWNLLELLLFLSSLILKNKSWKDHLLLYLDFLDLKTVIA